MVGILIAFALIALIDLRQIVQKRLWRDLFAFLAIFIPALAIALLLTFKVKVPSSMGLIGEFLKSVGLSY